MTHLRIELNTGLTEEVDSSLIAKLYECVINGELDNTSNLKGRLHVSKCYLEDKLYLEARFNDFFISADAFYIKIDDSVALNRLVDVFSSDGIGITYDDLSRIYRQKYNEYRDVNDNTVCALAIGTSTLFDRTAGVKDLRVLRYFTNFNCNYSFHYLVKQCPDLEYVSFPPKVTVIGCDVYNIEFRNCTKLKYVDFNNVTELRSGGFYGCTSLELENIPLQITVSDPSSFINSGIKIKDTANLSGFSAQDCNNITEITINLPVTRLGNRAFLAPNLTKVTFVPGSLNITVDGGGSGADILFRNDTSIDVIDFQDRINIINRLSFGFSKPSKIIFRSARPPYFYNANLDDSQNVAQASGSLFDNNKQIYVPDEYLNTYKTATYWSTYASQIHGISELPS